MAYTYSKIATYTVGSGGVATVDLLNIPQTYTDLVLKISGRTSNADISGGYRMRFNDNSVDTNHSARYLQSSGAATSSGSLSYLYLGDFVGSTATASTFGNMEIYIPNYTSSNYKSVSIDAVTENNATTAYTHLVAGLWQSTAPITSISILRASVTISQYSTFHLYGIKAEL